MEVATTDGGWLGLEVTHDGTRASVELEERHLTPFGRLYGGAGLSFVSAAIEAATGRRLMWATTQFVDTAVKGDRLELRSEVLAAGRRSSQVRVVARVDDILVLHGTGAAGQLAADVPDVVLPVAPVVPPPAACPEIHLPIPGDRRAGYLSMAQLRDAGTGEGPLLRWWMRFPGCPGTRPAMLGMVSDFIPLMAMLAIGVPGGGSSLDNTIRVGSAPDSEWVLVDCVPEQTVGGYGHGSVRVWGEDGSLAGTASQTAGLWRWTRAGGS